MSPATYMTGKCDIRIQHYIKLHEEWGGGGVYKITPLAPNILHLNHNPQAHVFHLTTIYHHTCNQCADMPGELDANLSIDDGPYHQHIVVNILVAQY